MKLLWLVLPHVRADHAPRHHPHVLVHGVGHRGVARLTALYQVAAALVVPRERAGVRLVPLAEELE